jgi:hypothetical protein
VAEDAVLIATFLPVYMVLEGAFKLAQRKHRVRP